MLVALLFTLTFSGGVLGNQPIENCQELCPKHEHFTKNDPTCPKTCGNQQQPEKAQCLCDPYTGCVCDDGYVRLNNDGTGPCVRPKKCEQCPKHEHFTKNDTTCPKTCGNQQQPEKSQCSCDPYTGCVCDDGYVRLNNDGTGPCVRPKKCAPTCCIPDACIRTCAAPNPQNCSYDPPNNNKDGCECQEGYILSEVGGKCIKIQDCPKDVPCNGDPNAQTVQYPAPCPSTCKSPDATPCEKMSEPIGCECKLGYILSDSTGKCILPDECPCGNPCGPNADFVPCKVNCPTDYCPVDDCRDIPSCEPGPTCLSGCVCKLNHKRKSREDSTCIVSSDCPPVQCTRPNEEWSKCPSACLKETCKDINNQPQVCQTLVLNCQPQCICKKNFFRNATDICVCPNEC